MRCFDAYSRHLWGNGSGAYALELGAEPSFDGFEDGTFYAFNAKCWHAGLETANIGWELLFLHFSEASNPRLPYMDDYMNATWFDFPAPYIHIPIGGKTQVNTALYSKP
ncbi:hypothetical protein [Pectobacterium wasabiae]|uniref:Aspartyl/asparaginy/proline hydroxylase domain-containing protein n=1 Tax=Pectobacterium wasabiae TaxID=55208 RepID=A0AAW3ENI6_9GAMM|nr:hypothetical protein [Pectobacterium wasabiae]AOR64680.1 hypothetical protein A7983_15770 [Pectobacterium wasabiae CFBP 3304]EJS93444.1 Hypothetical protein Y17_3470 [Pectobacterium wasabiae CFBP 3304]KFX08827.1 hypothetical protein JV38_03770 [Pectobacterium wasabiae]KGA28934.1 hypothetical protein KU73_07495 [Pectobacterium wasabiae]